MGVPSHDRHGHLVRAARRIPSPFVIPAREPEPRVWDLFQVASAQHKNFYEGWLDDEDVEQGLVRVRELLALLEAMPPEGGG